MKNLFNKQNIPYVIGIIISFLLIFLLIFSVFDFLNVLIIGSLGFTSYVFLLSMIAMCGMRVFNKQLNWKKSFWIINIVYISLTLLLLHYIFCINSFDVDLSSTLSFPYKNITILGSLGSLILYPLVSFTKTVGTIVILLSIIVVFVCISIDKVYYQTHKKDGVIIQKSNTTRAPKMSSGSMQISNEALLQNNSAPSFISMPLTLNAKMSKQKENNLKDFENTKEKYRKETNPILSQSPKKNTNPYISNETILEDVIVRKPHIIVSDATQEEDITSEFNYEKEVGNSGFIQDNSQSTIMQSPGINTPIIDDEINHEPEEILKEEHIEKQTPTENTNPFKKDTSKLDEEIRKVNKKKRKYVYPPLDLLTTQTTLPNLGQERFEEKAKLIEQKLEEFKINARCIGVTRGPAITRFEFEMPQGISVNKITQYSNDISMILEARKAIRIEAPIPGKNAFGIEVPNDKVDTVGLRDLVCSEEFKRDSSPLIFALGKDITNRNIYGNIAKLVHTLVAGSTGSGKSVCLNAILISMLYKCSPDDVRVLLIDPKFVEFNIYENLPHLLVPHIITEPSQAVNALSWAIEEMERRNRCFGQYYVRSIDEFNDLDEVKNGEEKKMPYIVIIVDELADLMMSSKKEIEDRILRLAQKARSAGIHMILATQRPSVDIITGTIKANLPSRIAFSLTNYMDSKTILDQGGAEKLLGRGDMLYLPRDLGEPVRLLGPFISNKEVHQIVDFVKNNNDADFDEEIEKSIFVQKSAVDMFNFDATSDEYFVQAVRVAIEANTVSTSFIQRKFGIGFQRASKLVDQMESMGYISPPQGANKARKVLITEEEFLEKYGGN